MPIEYDHFAAEDKYQPDRHVLSNEDPKSRSVVVAAEEWKTEAYQSTELKVSLKRPAGGDTSDIRKRLKTLLEAAGVEPDALTFGQEYGASAPLTATVNTTRNGMTLNAFLKALATDVEVDRNDTAYALITKEDACAMMTSNAKERGLGFQESGLMSVSTQTMDNTGGQRYGVGVKAPSYKDVSFNDFGAIESMREDGFVSKFAVEKHTSIKASEGMGKIVQEKLEAAGFDVHRQDGSPHMSVSAKPNGTEANIDNISNALAGANMIPAMAAQEINAVQPAAYVAPAAPAVTQAIKMNATR